MSTVTVRELAFGLDEAGKLILIVTMTMDGLNKDAAINWLLKNLEKAADV